MFRETPIGETDIQIIDGDRGKNYPKKDELLETGHTLFLNNKNIINNFLDDSFGEYITEEKSNSLRKGKLKRGDIVMSTRGSVGNIGYYSETVKTDNIRINSGMVILRNKDSNIDTEFLYILLRSNFMKQKYKEYITGSVQNQLPIRDLKRVPIIIPPLKIQKEIKNIILTIDSKIENNNAIIANLEEQAQAIFKSWFVDFEPFQEEEFVDSELGAIPKDWKVKYLLDLIEFKGGSQPPKKEHIYEYEDGYVRFIQNRDYNGQNNHITYIKESKKNRYADRYDILMDKYGEAGKTRYGIEGAYNVALAKIEPNSIDLREYIRRFLEQDSVQDYIYNSCMASTRPSVNKKSLSSIKLVIPPKNILEKFDNFSLTIIELILKYQDMNKKLAEIRDTLLPKLMSGEIR